MSDTIVAWEGWNLEVSPRWSPLKLEGGYAEGYALFADLTRPRLGVRWATAPKKKKFVPATWVAQMMKAEVGALAAAEARPVAMLGGDWEVSLLYVEPKPPGRDVWIGYSRGSARALQLIYHAHRREQILAQRVLPSVRDLHSEAMRPWSVFELSCRVPKEMELIGRQLNAGDLGLSFQDPRKRKGGWRRLLVRQVAVARLALARMTLEKWLARQQAAVRKTYRPQGTAQEVGLAAQQHPVHGYCQWSRRRSRFFWKLDLPARIMTYALHDAARDRLVLVEASHEDLAREVIASVGWARPGTESEDEP